MMSRPPHALARTLWTLGAGIAAWLSCGMIAFTTVDGARIGLLPASVVTILLVVGAAAGVFALLRAGAPSSPLSLLALVVLPWLPLPLPAALLLWSGPLAALVWFGVAALMLSSVTWPARLRLKLPVRPRQPAIKAGVIAAAIFAASAWRAAPSVPGGDEPHYLVITQSMLLDGDLKIENNHRRGDYRAFCDRDLQPHFQRRGRDGEIYSIHAPGLAALILPAFALAGYHGAVVFLILISAAGSGLAWWVAWLTTERSDAAWFAWAVVTMPVTTVFHSFSVFPDAPGGVLALTGVWALLRAERERRTGSGGSLPWFVHGIALAALPWLHTRFAVIAGGLGAVILLRLSTTRNPAAKAVAFLSLPAVSAVLWIWFFIALYGRPDPSAPYGAGEIGSLVWVPGGLAGLLFDQRFGLLPYAPLLAFAFVGLGVMLARSESRRLAIELLFVIVPYLLTVTHFPMWWAGWSAPARFFVPVLTMFAVPGAVLWVALAHRRERALPIAALAFTGLVTLMMVVVDRGRLAFNVRDTPALWLEWLSRGSDLAQAAPWWTRGGDGPLFRDIGIWIAAMLTAVLAVYALDTRQWVRSRNGLHVALTWSLAVAALVACTVVWTMRGTDGRNTPAAQLQLLRTVAAARPAVGVEIERVRPISPAAVPGELDILITRPVSTGRAVRDDRPLFEIPRVPAGEYRLTPKVIDPRGWLMIGLARDQFSLRTAPIPSPPQPIELRFPVTVRGIVVRGDEDARQTVNGLLLQPLSVLRAREWELLVARTAVRYAHATVFFLDERNFPEPDAFWIGGARTSSFVLQPDEVRRTMAMSMRNGPVRNHVTMEVAGARTELEFEPGEERRVAVPVDASRRAALVTVSVSEGFRPSDGDPTSRDHRFLGVWVKLD